MARIPKLSIVAAVTAIAIGGPAQAQGQNADLLEISPEWAAVLEGVDLSPNRFPSVFGAASAVGGQGGTGFVGLTYVNPREGISGSGADGDAVVGYSFGDATETIGVTVGLSITGLDPFGESGAVFFSASRQVASTLSSSTFIGFSASNLAAWGDAANQDEIYTVQMSHLAQLGTIPTQLILGYGNQTTLDENGSGNVDDGVFFGLGAGVSDNISLSLSGTATQLNLGMGLSVPDVPNLSISAGMFDVTDAVDRQQFSLSVAFGF